MKIIPHDKADEFNLIGKQIIRKKILTPTWIERAQKHKWD